jgi:hypothetical protein
VSGPARRDRRRGQAGQALVELGLVAPILLFLAFGVVAAGRVVGGKTAVVAVAREAARAGALAETPDAAFDRAVARGRDVAAGHRLGNGSLLLTVDPGDMARGGVVRTEARYEVRLDDLPLLGWVRVPVSAAHAERVDLYRSRWGAGK